MNENQLSKKLSFLLRHEIGKKDFPLDCNKNGFIDLKKILIYINEEGNNVSLKDIENLIKKDDRNRFSLENNKIKANYGHSFQIQTEPREQDTNIPEKLFALINKSSIEKIKRDEEFISQRKLTYLFSNKKLLLKNKNIDNKIILELNTSKLGNEFRISKNNDDIYECDNNIPLNAIKFINPNKKSPKP